MTRSETFRDRCERLPGVDLRTLCRDREFVAMKKAFSMLCYQHYNSTDTLGAIGKLIGRDHSTVHYYVHRTHFMEDTSPKRYTIEKHWYRAFKDLVVFDSPVGKIQINMLLGVL